MNHETDFNDTDFESNQFLLMKLHALVFPDSQVTEHLLWTFGSEMGGGGRGWQGGGGGGGGGGDQQCFDKLHNIMYWYLSCLVKSILVVFLIHRKSQMHN